MNVSLYQAAAAMNAHTQWQEIIAGNLAASSLPDFKKNTVSFGATCCLIKNDTEAEKRLADDQGR